MNQQQKTIITVIDQYLTDNPSIRFTQALFNLNINQFADNSNPENQNYLFRDNYNDKDDDVVARLNNNQTH